MVSIFYAFKSTSCCQEKPAEQVHLAMCPETPTLLSCLIKRECNRLVNPECSVSKERDFCLPANIFSQHFLSSSWQRHHFSHFFRKLHHEVAMKLGKGNKTLCYYNHYLCDGQTQLPSHKWDWQTGNSRWEGWGIQTCCGLSVLEEGL